VYGKQGCCMDSDSELKKINLPPKKSNIWARHCSSSERGYALIPKMAVADSRGGLPEGDEVVPGLGDVWVAPIAAM